MTLVPMQISSQPALKLATANMNLMLRFTMSPEVMSQASLAAGQLFQQAGATTLKVMQSNAFAELMQGMLNNYAEFAGEAWRSSLAAARNDPK